MPAVDPRHLPLLAAGRRPLTLATAAGAGGGLLVLAQAFAVAALVTDLVQDPGGTGWKIAAGWLLGVAVLRAACAGVTELATARAAGRISAALRDQVVRAGLLRRAPGEDRHDERALLATHGAAAVEPYLTRFLPALVLAAVLPPAVVVAIAILDPWAALVVVVTLPLVPVFAALIGVATRDRAQAQYRTLASLAGHFVDAVRGLPTLVAFDRAGVQSARIRAVTDRYRRATLSTLKVAFASSVALELVATLAVAVVAVTVGLRLAGGGLDLRTALTVLLLAPEAYWPLRRVGAEFHAAAEGVAALEQVRVLAEDRPSTPLQGRPDTTRVDPVPVHLREVTVRYPGAATPALLLAEARIPATGLTVIAGPSGSGKSTLLGALLGELDLERGEITLAGTPREDDWTRLVAHVPQTPWLTAGTVAENLRVARPRASDADLRDALTQVGLAEVVEALPQGLHTALGEDGAGLSSGQRARLALARVVLADRPYVLLDEPTAHLDEESERIILDTLVRLAAYTTVVAVAHRPALVEAAQTVIRLERPAAPVLAESSSAGSRMRSAAPTTPDPAPDLGPLTIPRLQRLREYAALLLGSLAALSGVALTATAGWLIVKSAEHPPVLTLMVAIVGVRTFGLARPVLRYAERLLSHDVALRLLAEHRARVYDVLVPLAPARLGRRRGDLLAGLVDDVDALLDDRLRVRQPVATAILVTVTAAGVVAAFSPAAGLVVLISGLAGGALAALVARAGARHSEPAWVWARAALAAEVLTTLENGRQLALWQADGAARERIRAAGDLLTRTARRGVAATAAGRAVVTVVTAVAVVATAADVAGSLAGSTTGLSAPVAALLVLVPLALADVLAPLPDAGALSVRVAAARARLADLERIEPAVHEPVAPAPAPATGAAALDLVGVSAGWDRRVDVLTHLHARVAAGGSVAVTGPSGSGKSTLAAVLIRFLEPHAGAVRLDGVDTGQIGSPGVRRRVCLVDDAPYLFATSVRENLRLARPGADDTALAAALTEAGLEDWLAALPDGWDTMLGSGGIRMSGGERARLGLARALLADPDVLLLDEPTAHLDRDSADRLASTVLRHRGRRTLVWITHDHAYAGRADLRWDLDELSRVSGGPASRAGTPPGPCAGPGRPRC